MKLVFLHSLFKCYFNCLKYRDNDNLEGAPHFTKNHDATSKMVQPNKYYQQAAVVIVTP